MVTKGQFLDLSFIQNPDQHEARIVTADAFTDRPVWLFPFLPLSRRGNITGWVFRADSSLQSMDLSSENVPSFELWRESMHTSQQDYIFVMSGSVQAVDGDIPSVYEQTLTTPLLVSTAEHYILGIRLPLPENASLYLSFQKTKEGTDRLSYYSNAPTLKFMSTTNPATYRDNIHVPLVSPLYGKLEISSQE